ncbi:hypothetical protein [Nonomuraea sp. NPDC049028]|uniref:hypothetical protein n=1 Tax=Nonomuraea sp. NPDC049028 TaxID=3364348 RepID=UPI00371B224A
MSASRVFAGQARSMSSRGTVALKVIKHAILTGALQPGPGPVRGLRRPGTLDALRDQTALISAAARRVNGDRAARPIGAGL